MKLYICQDIMQIFQIEIEHFGRNAIYLTPVWVEGEEPTVWAISDTRNSAEAIVELKSEAMSIWVPHRCLAELDEQVIVRGRRGFTIGALTDLSRSQATLFVGKDI